METTRLLNMARFINDFEGRIEIQNLEEFDALKLLSHEEIIKYY